MKKKAFTLAEVLTTLMVIGVVAALTIPILSHTFEKTQFKTAYKVAFSELQKAYDLLQVENAQNMFSKCKDYDDACLRDLFALKLQTIKKCEGNNCNPESKFLNGSSRWGDIDINSGWPTFYTNKGYSVKARMHRKNCKPVSNVDKDYPECGWFQIDVNGTKEPNTAGEDIFFVYIYNDTLSPFPSAHNKQVEGWTDKEALENDCEKGTGVSCSTTYLQ